MLSEKPQYGINAAAVPLTGLLPVYIRITDISDDGYFKPTEKVGVNSTLSHLYQLSEGDIVLARTGASVGKSYLYNQNDGLLIYAGFLIKMSPNKSKLDPKYLSQYLKTEKYWDWVTVNSMRSQGGSILCLIFSQRITLLDNCHPSPLSSACYAG
ncbi:restriction endonuclease subunit S domain-containing protein [Oceanisphaera profunda]|uniref:hypothetical protein n=1 Tax=Oceanisphaera profunda TaxID=1416627 RepID=UPI00125FDDBD|nr:hypothetical protein [Oceanisphaera profunda]